MSNTRREKPKEGRSDQILDLVFNGPWHPHVSGEIHLPGILEENLHPEHGIRHVDLDIVIDLSERNFDRVGCGVVQPRTSQVRSGLVGSTSDDGECFLTEVRIRLRKGR